MPYKKFTKRVGGRKFYCTKNLKTGKVTHYTSESNRVKGIRLKEAFAHGFVPTHNRFSKKGKRHEVGQYWRR